MFLTLDKLFLANSLNSFATFAHVLYLSATNCIMLPQSIYPATKYAEIALRREYSIEVIVIFSAQTHLLSMQIKLIIDVHYSEKLSTICPLQLTSHHILPQTSGSKLIFYLRDVYLFIYFLQFLSILSRFKCLDHSDAVNFL